MKARRIIKLTPVKELPKKCYISHQHDLQKIFDEFLAMPHEIVKVELDRTNYTNIKSAYQSFINAVNTYKYPVKVALRQGEIYLVKKKIT